MLTVITGPMFAGKSSKLISMASAHAIAGHLVLGFKPANDKRYGNEYITTHLNEKFPATSIDSGHPSEIIRCMEDFQFACQEGVDVVVVDETQFFNSDNLIHVVEALLYIHRKTIILSGLSQDSSGQPFGAMPHLLAIADDIIHLKAVCAKSKKIGAATRTFRKDANNTNQVAIGGAEMYEPRSFHEWLMASPRTT